MERNDILEFKNVTKTFPGVVALDSVSLAIRKGEIHGICGENGAGKSTLVKILAGVYPHGEYDGSILLNGSEIRFTGKSIRHAIEAGIAIVYQELTLVRGMTVGENIFLGKEPLDHGVINWNRLYAESRRILDKFGLDISPLRPVRDLGVGKQQMAEIAKALSEDASIIIFDEPTSALSEDEVDKLMEIIVTLKEHGVTCIYISHKLEEFFRIADRVTVMRDGRVVETAGISELSLERMVGLMVGRTMTERFPAGARRPAEVILKVEGLRAMDPVVVGREVLRGVSFEVRRGEILGIAGLMGSGRTELVTTLFGEYGRIIGGSIVLDGREIAPQSAQEAMRAGISLVPEDRKQLGLVLMQSILENIALPNLNRFSSFMRIDRNAALKEALRYSASLAIKAPNLFVPVESLSGGNQQKVVISKWLMTNPKILILDDPTRGIDVGAKYEIYKLMNRLAEEGVALIVISSELEEVIGMSDRILVMCGGRSAGMVQGGEATQEKIMALATGVAENIGANGGGGT